MKEEEEEKFHTKSIDTFVVCTHSTLHGKQHIDVQVKRNRLFNMQISESEAEMHFSFR